MPLHRLNEKPTVNAILVDITCDSDGKIYQFIDLQDVRDYLAAAPAQRQSPTTSASSSSAPTRTSWATCTTSSAASTRSHVFLEDDEADGFYIEESINGNSIGEVLKGVQYIPQDLSQRIKKQVNKAIRQNIVKPREGVRLIEFYDSQLTTETYLNINYDQDKEPTPDGKRLS